MDGQNDFGEDQHVTFTEDGAVTGDLVKIQVKGWPFVAQGRPSARRSGEVLKTITISPDRKLDDESITDFVAEVRRYRSRYRGNRIIQAQLGEMAGVEFGPSDIVQHHVNVYGEDLIFWQRRGSGGSQTPPSTIRRCAPTSTHGTTPWREMSDKARRLVTFYLAEEVRVDSPALPIDTRNRLRAF